MDYSRMKDVDNTTDVVRFVPFIIEVIRSYV